MENKLKLNFSHVFDGKIWNIDSSASGDSLLLEIRSEEKFETKFFILDTKNHTFLAEDIDFDEKWWIGVSFLNEKYAVFHIYAEQDNPDLKNILVYEIGTDTILWQRSHCHFIAAQDDVLVLFINETEEVQYFDIRTGINTDKKIADDILSDKNKSIHQPFHYSEGTDHFDKVGRFLASTYHIKVKAAVEYFENDELMVISYYCINRFNTLDNILIVIDHDGNQILYEKLGENLTGISADTFFICKGNLIFVKDKINIYSYQLA